MTTNLWYPRLVGQLAVKRTLSVNLPALLFGLALQSADAVPQSLFLFDRRAVIVIQLHKNTIPSPIVTTTTGSAAW